MKRSTILAIVVLALAARAAWSAPDGFVFEPNVGQAGKDVRFLSRGGGVSAFLAGAEVTLVLPGRGPAPAPLSGREPRLSAAGNPHIVRLSFPGADAAAALVGEEPRAGRSNYLRGRDPKRWQTDVPHFGRVRARAVYPGIDILYLGQDGELRYDFVVRPGADPRLIGLQVDGAAATLDPRGDLVLTTASGELVQGAPSVYQVVKGARRRVSGRYELRDPRRIGLRLGPYDKRLPLVIDPVLRVRPSSAAARLRVARLAQPYWLSYLGDSESDDVTGIAVDATGSTYVSGTTCPAVLPPGALVIDCQGYVEKLSPDGKSLVYVTSFGGDAWDGAFGVAVDAFGQAHVAGGTQSLDFPTTPGVLRPQWAGPDYTSEGFVAKLNAAGNGFVYATYLGSEGNDLAHAIALGPDGNAYVGGEAPVGFPTTTGALQSQAGSIFDAFVAVIDPSGTSLVYSTFLGGDGDHESVSAIAVDGDLNVYVAGRTDSTNFPLANAARSTLGDGANDVWGWGDGFATKLNPAAGTLVYSTYLGGAGTDDAWGIALDGAGNAYVAGLTNSQDFLPLVNAHQAARRGVSDAFLTKLDPAGAVVYSTYFGGGSYEMGWSVGADPAGVAGLVGYTESTDLPATGSGFQPRSANGRDGFMARFNPAGVLLGATYLGGRMANASAMGFAGSAVKAVATAAGAWYLGGVTTCADLPANGHDTTANGAGDGFVLELGQSLRTLVLHAVEFNAPSYAVAENGGQATITVSRRGLILPAASVHYGAYPGTASAGTDFVAATGTLSFLPGERSTTFTVAVRTDLLAEGTETVGLVLSGPTGGLILGRQHTAVLSITDATAGLPQ